MASRPPKVGKETPALKALLQAIVDSSDDAIYSTDTDGVVTSWNKSAERIFGYPPSEVVDRPHKLLIPPDRQGEDETILQKIRAGVRIDHFETVRMRRDGRLFDVSVSFSPVKSAAGKIVGASVVARDISEAKRMARADVLLTAIVNSSEDAIVSKNLDGIITSWNASAERLFGYKPEEIIGQPVLKLIPDDRKDEEPRIIERLRRGERVEHFETVRVRKNGELFPVSLTISPVRNAAGEIVGASKIARDISDAKRAAIEREALLESERLARAQAERASRLKDDFLSTVSHELRTPLNAIVGWTDLLAEGDQDRAEVARGIDIIKKNAMMQAQLIDDLLDLGRITSGKMVLHVEPVSISTIVHAALASVQHAADAKRISLRATVGDIPGGLLADPRRLQQVVWNLLINAIKFTQNDGRVMITVTRNGSLMEIIVSDNGRGIASDFLPFVFERFRQADASTTKQHGGLGIGLALVKQLVELHGGKVTVRSGGLGQGATFTVSLPISAAHAEHPVASDVPVDPSLASLADLVGLKVLAVDDDADSLEIVTRILTSRHAEVRVASSVSDAMEVLKTYSPDIVLSDIGMPKQDGFEFVRLLRAKPFFAGVPAVALTALARGADRTRALNAGFQTHIAKPVAAAELVAVVHSLGKLHTMRDSRPPR